jgi:hypothetical protein
MYSNKKSARTGGMLDVDMNAGGRMSRTPVENITYPNKRNLIEGRYKLVVNNYSKRESTDVGFTVEVEFGGVIRTFHYDRAVPNGKNVTVCEFDYSHKDGIKFVDDKGIASSEASVQIWNVNTQNFCPVSVLMASPNHWDDQEIGNKHYFFMLEGCKTDTNPRGFFNEFLKDDLMEQKKVFEAMGGKMKVEDSDAQLSGLGFSTTKRDSIVVRVQGSFTRTLKIKF